MNTTRKRSEAVKSLRQARKNFRERVRSVDPSARNQESLMKLAYSIFCHEVPAQKVLDQFLKNEIYYALRDSEDEPESKPVQRLFPFYDTRS